MPVWVGVLILGAGLAVSLLLPVPQALRTSFDAGQSLYALGEYEGAIVEYDKIVRFDSRAVCTDSVCVRFDDDLSLPVVAAAWYQLGNAYKKSGKLSEAVDAYRRVMDERGVPEDFRSMVQYQLAETRFLQKDYSEAAAEYRRFAELFPQSADAGKAFFYSGWSEFSQKEYDKAIATLREMLQDYPQDRYAPDAQFRIASAYLEKGDRQRAIDEAQVVLDRYPNSPAIAQAAYLRATALDQMGNGADAVAAYRAVRTLYDRMSELLRGSFREGKSIDFDNYRQLFETASLRIAEILSDEGRFSDALDELRAAQETAQERYYKARVQMRIGDLCLKWGSQDAGHYEDAWRAYGQVIEQYADTPYPPNAQYQKGEVRYYAGDYAASRAEYLKVVEAYPDSDPGLQAAALYSAAWSAEKVGSRDAALESYSAVVQRFPRSEQAPLCLLRIGRISFDAGKYPEAAEAYRAIVESYADTRHAADAWYGLGLVCRDTGKPAEAVAAFSRVDHTAGATYIAALTSAASICIQEGQADRGRALLDQLLQGVQGNPELEAQAHLQTAQLELNNGRYADALARYTRVVEEYPQSEVVTEARYGRVLALYRTGQYAPALAEGEWLLSHDVPQALRPKVLFSMALSYAASGQDERAVPLLQQVLATGDEALTRSSRQQLMVVAERQDPRRAVQTYEEVLKGTVSGEELQSLLLRLAGSYLRAEEYQKGIDAAARLLEVARDPESVSNALFLQGSCYYHAGDYPKAIAAYQQVLDRYPDLSWGQSALFQMGVCYSRIGGPEALPAMHQAFSTYYTRYPQDAERTPAAYYYDAWARYRLGEWAEASAVFDELARRHPECQYAAEAQFRAGEALYNLTRRGAADREPRLQEAMAHYGGVLARYADSEYADDALYNKAWCLISLDRPAEAVPIFERIVAQYPDGRYGPRSQFSLGDYYYGLRDYTRATQSYQRFLDLYPASRLDSDQFDPADRGLAQKAQANLDNLAEIDAYALYAQGEKLFKDEDYDRAMEVFRQVQEKFPQSGQAVSAAVNIGAALVARAHYREAASAFQGVVDRYGDNPTYASQVNYAREQLEVLQEARVL